MKKIMTAEEVQARINMLQAMVEDVQKDLKKAQEEVTQQIIDNASDPEYIERWIHNWNGMTIFLRERLVDLNTQITHLNWFFKEEK